MSNEMVLTALQIKQVEQEWAQQHDGSTWPLMVRASESFVRQFMSKLQQRNVVILVGCGNNGGDGLVSAALAQAQQFEVQVLLVGGAQARDRLSGEALEALHWAESRGVKVEVYAEGVPLIGEVIVDGL